MEKKKLMLCVVLVVLGLVLLVATLCRTAGLPLDTVRNTETPAQEKPGTEETKEADAMAELKETDAMTEIQSEEPLSTPVPTVQELSEQLLTEYDRTDGHITGEMRELLSVMRGLDPAAAERWTCLFETWEQVECSMKLNGSLEGAEIPEDDSLCIVVLGYQLREQGGMAPELLGRLRTALACAKEYPEAYIAVTGGGTAKKNESITEAGRMAEWLQEHGIAKERIIVEDKSLSTVENALFTGKLLQERGIRAVIIVTSNYHIRRGCMVFTAQALFADAGYRVVANRSFFMGEPEKRTPRGQMAEVRDVLYRLEHGEYA